MIGRCFIFGALPAKNPPVTPEKDDFVIAADKGVLNMRSLGLSPDVIIGDFDSLGFTPEGNVIKLPVIKDKTDVGYAVDYALDKGFREFHVFGAGEGLLDHTVANLQICAAVSKKGGVMRLYSKNQVAFCVTNGTASLKGSGRVSVFAFGGEARGVTLTGLFYPLENANLESFFPLGVSNSFVDGTANVSVKSGTLLIIHDIP